jgi:hypothetical protein
MCLLLCRSLGRSLSCTTRRKPGVFAAAVRSMNESSRIAPGVRGAALLIGVLGRSAPGSRGWLPFPVAPVTPGSPFQRFPPAGSVFLASCSLRLFAKMGGHSTDVYADGEDDLCPRERDGKHLNPLRGVVDGVLTEPRDRKREMLLCACLGAWGHL